MVHLDVLDKAKIILLFCICLSFTTFILICFSSASPWYKLLDFQSDSPSWDCSIKIQRNAFYSWKQCDCNDFMFPDSALLPSTWCSNGIYDWRGCENCDTLGCACSLEVRVWNASIGFILLAFSCSGASTLLLLIQIFDKFSKTRSPTVHIINHILNILTLLFLISGFLIFLRITPAIKEDYGNRCNSNFGICDSFMGSRTEQQLKFGNIYYLYNEKWGPLMGFWVAFIAIVFSFITELFCLIYTYLIHKQPYPIYENIK